MLDGIPMGRPDAFGGSPIFRYVDNENLQQVRASPGSGDISLPSATSLGPVVEYLTTDPSDEFGATLQITFGDDNLQRTFIKLETGDLDGFSGYVSRSKTDSDLWRGPGTIDREHFEGKIRYEFDDNSYISAQIVHNDFFDYDSPSVSRAAYDATTDTSSSRNGVGRNIAYLGTVPDLGTGPASAKLDPTYSSKMQTILGIILTVSTFAKDLLFGLTIATNLTDNLDFHINWLL